jgi:hypothetical protein
MKCLVFSHVALWPPHHAETVEMALNEYNAGNEVVFLSCVGVLATCPANPFKKETLCKQCRKQTEYTKSIILPEEIIKIDLKFDDNKVRKISKIGSIEDLKKIEVNNVPFGKMIYSTLTTAFNDSFFDVFKHKGKIDDLIRNAINLFDFGLKFIETEKVEQIYVWNGRRSSEGPLTYAAKKHGVNFSTFICGGRYNTLLIRDGVHFVQHIPSAGNDLKEIVNNIENNVNALEIVTDAVNFYNFMSGSKKRAHINNKGIIQFSTNYAQKISSKKVNKSISKTIAVFVGTYSEYAGVLGYDEPNDFCKNFYEGVSFLQENLYRIKNAELIIRWHPNSAYLKGNEAKMLSEVIDHGKKINNVTHIKPSSNFNTYGLIKDCDVVVGFGTSVSVEACLYGKPVIFIGHNMFESLKCFQRVTSFEKLIQLLNTPIQVGNFNHAIAWGYYFGSNGGYQFKHLEQRQDELFFYKNKRLLVWPKFYRKRLGIIKRTVYDFFQSV